MGQRLRVAEHQKESLRICNALNSNIRVIPKTTGAQHRTPLINANRPVFSIVDSLPQVPSHRLDPL
jgi:hypothetical protein